MINLPLVFPPDAPPISHFCPHSFPFQMVTKPSHLTEISQLLLNHSETKSGGYAALL